MNKHLEFYNQCMETGQLPHMEGTSGLCSCARNDFISKELLDVFRPTDNDETELADEKLSVGWWGSGVSTHDQSKYFGFTELRQTIVAFMCVITIEDFEKESE